MQSEAQQATSETMFDRVLTSDAAIDRDHRRIYDGIGRGISSELLNGDGTTATVIRSTDTAYDGYATTSFVPVDTGDTNEFGSTTTTNDVYGNVVRIDEDAPGLSPATHTTRYTYNMRFDRVRITDPIGAVTKMTYNDLGWQTSIDDPNGGQSFVWYYRSGEVRETIDANVDKVSRFIDDRGRVRFVANGTNPASASNRLSQYTYDPPGEKGTVASMASYVPAGTKAWEHTATGFDDLGRVTDWTIEVLAGDSSSTSADDELGDVYAFSQSFTRSGDPVDVVYPAMAGAAAETVTHDYSSLGYLLSATSPSDSYIAARVYDPLGRILAETNGAAGVVSEKAFNYQPSDGRMFERSFEVPALSIDSIDRYEFDAPGNVTEIEHDRSGTLDDERECFDYDTRQRLIDAYTLGTNGSTTTPCPTTAPADPTEAGPAPYDLNYAYDPADRFSVNANRDTITHDAPSPSSGCKSGTNPTKPHAMASINAGNGHPAMSMTYDCNGAMTQRQETGGTTWTYTWDTQRRLTAVQESGQTASTNVYDPNGQRVVRVDPNGDRTIYFGTTELIYNATTTEVRARRFYTGGEVSLWGPNGQDDNVTTAANHQGSVTDHIDATTSDQEIVRYDPYGALRDGNLYANKGFLGQTRDNDQNLVYLNNRHYDPTTGVFVSVDPLVTMTGQPYIYGAANPVTFSDPTGLEVCGVRDNSEYRCWDDYTGPGDSDCPYENCAGPNRTRRTPPAAPVTTREFDSLDDTLLALDDLVNHGGSFADGFGEAAAGSTVTVAGYQRANGTYVLSYTRYRSGMADLGNGVAPAGQLTAVARKTGLAFLVLDVGVTGFESYRSTEGEPQLYRIKYTIAKTAATTAGAAGGAVLLGKAGGSFGTAVGGPPGTAIGLFAGGVIGAIGGGWLAGRSLDVVWDYSYHRVGQ